MSEDFPNIGTPTESDKRAAKNAMHVIHDALPGLVGEGDVVEAARSALDQVPHDPEAQERLAQKMQEMEGADG